MPGNTNFSKGTRGLVTKGKVVWGYKCEHNVTVTSCAEGEKGNGSKHTPNCEWNLKKGKRGTRRHIYGC